MCGVVPGESGEGNQVAAGRLAPESNAITVNAEVSGAVAQVANCGFDVVELAWEDAFAT